MSLNWQCDLPVFCSFYMVLNRITVITIGHNKEREYNLYLALENFLFWSSISWTVLPILIFNSVCYLIIELPKFSKSGWASLSPFSLETSRDPDTGYPTLLQFSPWLKRIFMVFFSMKHFIYIPPFSTRFHFLKGVVLINENN